MSLLCTTFSLVLGLYFLRNNIAISIIISIAYLIFIWVRFNKKTFIIGLSLFAIGATIGNLNLEYNSKNKEYSGIVLETKKNYFLFQSHYEKFYVYEKENNYEVGDYLVIDGYPSELKITTYESQFNFKEYLHNKGVKRELKTNNIDSKFNTPIKIKAFKNRFLSNFDENTRALVNAFLFNEKDYSSEAIKFTSDLNLNHLFSMSGVYLHIIFSALTYILAFRFSEKASELLPFIILLPYAFFSLSKVGTLRVYALYLLKFLNKHYFKKKFNHIELVSILALIFISFDYHLVYQETFYIGFLLSVLTPFVNNSLSFLKPKKRKRIMPLITYLFLLPIIVRDGSLRLFTFFFSSFLIIPNLLIIIITMFSLIFRDYRFVNNCGGILTWILEKLDRINLSIPISDLGGTFAITFLLLFFIGIYLLETVRIKRFKTLICCEIFLVLIAIVPLQDPLINAVYFINVGQGDSILIKNRTKTVMIDTGGYKGCDMAKDSLIPFMNKKKITHIDALITTHDDFDHNGAVSSLFQNFKIFSYINKPSDFPYKIGDLEFNNFNDYNGTDDNDKSLVLSLNFMNKKWLFMGDASINVEKYLIRSGKDIDCDILKIGHHGSKTSTCEPFLKATSPKTAIISVGENNYYKHPNEEVIELLNKYSIEIRRTDKEGTISYLSLFT